MSPSVRDIATAIEEARQTVPDLRVRFHPDCQGKAWLVDVCCSTVYVSSHLPFEDALGAITDGVATLVKHTDPSAPPIPSQRSDSLHECA